MFEGGAGGRERVQIDGREGMAVNRWWVELHATQIERMKGLCYEILYQIVY
jgi:hypothetical protein